MAYRKNRSYEKKYEKKYEKREAREETSKASGALAELMNETESIDRHEQWKREHDDGLKPRGIRRYERMSSMGGEDE